MCPNACASTVLLILVTFGCLIINGTTQNDKNSIKYIDTTVAEGETYLSYDDFQNIERSADSRRRRQSIQEPTVNSGDDDSDSQTDESAMYNRDRFEGDIVNPKLSEIDNEQANQTKGFVMRNAVRQTYLKWPNGRIPYTISTQYTSFGRARIAAAIQEYQNKTCIQFVPKTDSDLDYVHIVPEQGCYSMVGRIGGKQPVSIGNGCIAKGIIIHELMHSVGFFHEQSRADRDSYIRIIWSNVEEGLEDQFDKYSMSVIDHLNTNYDYASIMHYGPSAFSRNGQVTIEPLEKGVTIGQRIGFSNTDLYKINKLYDCPNRPNGGSAMQSVLPITVTKLPDDSIQNVGSVSHCVDLHDECLLLAERGHCSTMFARAFMQVGGSTGSLMCSVQMNCPLTCNYCSSVQSASVTPVCEDGRPWCERFARNGMCTVFLFSSYMRSRCAFSCGAC